MHRLNGDGVAGRCVLLLLADDGSAGAGTAGIVQDHGRFQFVHDPGFDLEGVDDDDIVLMEFHEVEPAESGRILVLLAAGEGEVLPLDFVRETGRFVVSQGQVHPFGEALEDTNDHGGGRTQAGSGRCVVVGRDPESPRDGPEILHDTLVNAPDEVRGRRKRRVQRAFHVRVAIVGIDPDRLPRLRLDGAVGGKVDGGVEDLPPVQVAVRRDVAASSGEAEPERRFAADNHTVMFYSYKFSYLCPNYQPCETD